MSQIQKIATQVVEKLKEHSHIAYFAGGFVRDLLLNQPSSDIDIATNALPEQIAKIFPEHALVGAQFGVCIIRHKGHQFEVATFRRDISYTDGRRPTEVHLMSSPEEDAKRRDFTINGMFFDPLTNEILDFVGGQKDLAAKQIRTIGNPFERFEEDRLRMVRAVRFQTRLEFSLEKETSEAIKKLSHTLLPAVSMERIWQELCKMRQSSNFCHALIEMAQLGLLGVIFPPLRQLSLATLQQRLAGLDTLPEKVPTILILTQLFSPEDLAFVLGLGIYLKASKEETKMIETYLEVVTLWQSDKELSRRYDWTYLLADMRSKACLELLFAKLRGKEKKKSMSAIDSFAREFTSHIDRIHKRRPICRAGDLEALGIRPGKKMGELLRAAEKIAIDANIHEPEEILLRLRTDPLWLRHLEDTLS